MNKFYKEIDSPELTPIQAHKNLEPVVSVSSLTSHKKNLSADFMGSFKLSLKNKLDSEKIKEMAAEKMAKE